MKLKRLFVIVGKASSGKDTIAKKVCAITNIPMALSFTTRPMRNKETQGVEYSFITNREFYGLHNEGRLAEYTEYDVAGGDRWYYGLTRSELEKNENAIIIVNPDGVNQLRKIYKDKMVVFYIVADDKHRVKRYLDRDTSNNTAECCRRYLADEKDFKDFESDYTITNDDGCSLRENIGKIVMRINQERAKVLREEMDAEFFNNPAKFIGEGRC